MFKPGDVIVIIIDEATQHCSDEVRAFVASLNAKLNPGRVVLSYIRAHLTSILQVGDFVFNSPIKNTIRKKYWAFRESKEGARPAQVGRFRIDRSDMVRIVEDTVEEYNQDSLREGRARNAFEKCGLNPFIASRIRFHEHLESLSIETMYRSKKASQGVLKLQ